MERCGKLHFLCGKMAVGKSTLSKALVAREDAVLIAQDDLLEALFLGEIVDLEAFVKYSTRIQNALEPRIASLLSNGLSVVLDSPAIPRKQRAWFRHLWNVPMSSELHFIVASDECGNAELKQRREQRGRPPGAKWTTDTDFDAVTAYFDPPRLEENVNIVFHERSG